MVVGRGDVYFCLVESLVFGLGGFHLGLKKTSWASLSRYLAAAVLVVVDVLIVVVVLEV